MLPKCTLVKILWKKCVSTLGQKSLVLLEMSGSRVARMWKQLPIHTGLLLPESGAILKQKYKKKEKMCYHYALSNKLMPGPRIKEHSET